MDDLQGKVVLVTGASSGIGEACAKAFAKAGSKVIVHYNSSDRAAQQIVSDIQKSGGESTIVQGDLRTSEGCNEVVQKAVSIFGHIDVLVNNAGDLIQRINFTEVTDELFDDVINLNVRSMVSCVKFAVPHMSRGGAIINLSSMAARTGGGTGSGVYAAAKAFVSTATRNLAKELAGRGIRVNAVSPGVISTAFHTRHSKAEQLEANKKTIPLGRLGEPIDCAGTIVYLASNDLSGYVTGQVIEVNGGQFMG